MYSTKEISFGTKVFCLMFIWPVFRNTGIGKALILYERNGNKKWQILSNTELDANAIKEEARAVDTTKKLKIGIIGTGWIAYAHIESYKKMPDVEIVAGADLVPGKAEKFFKENRCRRCQMLHQPQRDDWQRTWSRRSFYMYIQSYSCRMLQLCTWAWA